MDGWAQLLPSWLMTAALPSVALMGFFWKGDEALSEEFRKWLSDKILGVKWGGTGIEPLGRVFDVVYGERWFAMSTFLRVAAVSALAATI